MAWSLEEKAAIKRMWNEEGLSASQIARCMATEFNHPTSRNAIIGVVHRSGGSNRTTAIGAPPRVRVPKAPVEGPIERLRPRSRQQLIDEAGGMELYGPANDFPALGMCRYIAGDPSSGHWACCGWPTGARNKPDNQQGDINKSWCDAHEIIVRTPSGRMGQPHHPDASYVTKPVGNPRWRLAAIAAEGGVSHTQDLRDDSAA